MSEEKSRRRTPYPAEMKERAIRMVLDHQDEYRRTMTRAELTWVEEVIEELRRGELTWSEDIFDAAQSSMQEAGVISRDPV